MEYKRLTVEYCGTTGEIEEDKAAVGAYLHVSLPDGTQYDELQNTVLDCLQNAEEEYGIPLKYWQNAPSIVA